MNLFRWIVVALVAAFALVGFVEPADADGKACPDLSAELRAEYQALNSEFLSAYGDKRYDDVLAALARQKEICPSDLGVELNFAKTHNRLKNCAQAYAYATEVAASTDDRFTAEVENAKSLLREIEAGCNTTLALSCSSQTDVSVRVRGEGIDDSGTCDRSLEVPPGDFEIEASLPDHVSWSTTVSLEYGERLGVAVPELSELVDSGLLTIVCDSAQILAVDVIGNGSSQRMLCGESVELSPGEYTLQQAGGDYTETVTMELGLTKEVDFGATTVFESAPRTGFFLGLRVATGTGWGSGDVFDADGDTINSYDDIQPTNFPLGLVNELGYAFTETWAVAVRTRVELLNPAVLFQAVGRATAVQVDWFALRFDLGIGGGQKLPMPILFDNDSGNQVTGIVESGPVQASAGINAAFFVSEIFGIVVAIETHVGFPDFGVQIDWGNAGLEVQF